MSDETLKWEDELGETVSYPVARVFGFKYELPVNRVGRPYALIYFPTGEEIVKEFYKPEEAKAFCQAHHNAICAEIEEAKPKWISVSERLPEERTLVSVAYPDGGVLIDSWFKWATMERPMWFRDADGNRTPTHWMPLPNPPAQDKGEA